MTQAAKIRIAVYFGALAYPIALIWTLVALRSPAIDSVSFYLCAFILLFFIAVARWDIVGYGLHFILLLLLLGIAYKRGGWLPSVLVIAMFLFVQALLRRSGRGNPIELSFPLAGGTYLVAHGGNLRLLNHHRVSKSQAYALDIVQLNWLGMRAAGICPRRLAKYRILGDVLYSPCNGTVTAVVNDVADLLPGEMDKKHVAGNYIVIQLHDAEIYIGLTHLMQGSVKVKPGERVSMGQALARVGNSGNTSEPHLHIHAKRSGDPKSMLDGAAVPMRFGGRWLIRNSIVRNVVELPGGTELKVEEQRRSGQPPTV